MTDAEESAESPVDRARRRRRLAEVFGEVLPTQTGDDTDAPADERAADDRLRREVPPHHGS